MNLLSLVSKDLGISKTSDNDYIGFDGIFKLDARAEEKETGNSIVTKFYVEDGSPISDHIINEPRVLSITGVVSDIAYPKDVFPNSFTETRDTLGDISIYLPNWSLSQINKIDKYTNVYANAKRRVDKYKSVLKKVGIISGSDTLKTLTQNSQGETSVSKQAQFIDFMKSYHNTKRTMKIETIRLGVFENMALNNYTFSNREDGKLDYNLEFIEIRTAKTILTDVKKIAKKPTGSQSKAQTQDKQDKGVVQGDKTTTSKTTSLLGKIFG